MAGISASIRESERWKFMPGVSRCCRSLNAIHASFRHEDQRAEVCVHREPPERHPRHVRLACLEKCTMPLGFDNRIQLANHARGEIPR